MAQRPSTETQIQDLRAPHRKAGDEQPQRYDQIVRGAVPLPDSSYRPTQAEEALASELTGLRIVSASAGEDTSAEAAVRDALAGAPQVDASDLRVVIHAGTLALEGSVASVRDRDDLIATLSRVPTIDDVVATSLRIRGG